ncbi:lytic transglycosylase domain-containing protein [Caballeronia sp. EK]|uniref:lytic transglycosylase domain-containing protein n=1 Tax=Caballeronia sp. EK TaxID=2767469 RepID=UPI0016562367|nr:lytic transglycosylase domain-containing protein [Caballeronia sp. EK]MBC8642780.1 lytic transglycosylase domain-containing protein [Caballeronia sp. EK]
MELSSAGGPDPGQIEQIRTASSRVRQFDALIVDISEQYGVDPLLVHAVIRAESNYEPLAISNKGALGLMQVMPATGMRFGKSTLAHPRDNLEAGVAYLSWLTRRFEGRLDLALAGYNAGEGAVARYGNVVPPYAETQTYVRRVLGYYTGLSGGPVAAERSRPTEPVVAAGRKATRESNSLRLILDLLIGSPLPAVDKKS